MKYRGQNSRGTHVTGMSKVSPEVFIASAWKARWQRLVVEVDGEEVGGITGAGHPAGRAWWVERSVVEEQDELDTLEQALTSRRYET